MTYEDMIEAWLEERIGCGYVWGATGWVCTPERRQQQAKQYPSYAETILTTCAKWDGKKCYDCAQLIVQAAKLAGLDLPSGATSLWKKVAWEASGPIETAPKGRLICLFRDDGTGTKQHVGWRTRGGDTYDARGSATGVVKNKSYKGWTHWGVLPGLDRKVEESKVETGKIINGKLRLRASASTSSTVTRWMEDGDTVNILEDCGEWLKVGYKGSIGYCMAKFIQRSGVTPGDIQTPVVSPGESNPDVAVSFAIGDKVTTINLPYSAAVNLRDALICALGVG